MFFFFFFFQAEDGIRYRDVTGVQRVLFRSRATTIDTKLDAALTPRCKLYPFTCEAKSNRKPLIHDCMQRAAHFAKNLATILLDPLRKWNANAQ